MLEYICFNCFHPHVGQRCPKCFKGVKSSPKLKKVYEIEISKRDEHGDSDQLYHFKIDEIDQARKCYINEECNDITINVFRGYEKIDYLEVEQSPKYIQALCRRISNK